MQKLITILLLLMLLVGCQEQDTCSDCHNTRPRVVQSGFPTLEPEP